MIRKIQKMFKNGSLNYLRRLDFTFFSNPQEIMDKINLHHKEKKGATVSNIIKAEVTAIVDKLLEFDWLRKINGNMIASTNS